MYHASRKTVPEDLPAIVPEKSTLICFQNACKKKKEIKSPDPEEFDAKASA
jgi:hypothetical protein